jgi:hypothetical protein
VAWTEGGIYAAVLSLNLSGTTGPPWDLTTNSFFLTSNSDAPNFAQAAASAIYAATNEVTGTGWAAGGIACSALGAGATSIAPALSVTGPGPSVLVWNASPVSVAATTITGAFGGYFYWAAGGTQYKYIGIWFGGAGYSTTAGTFGITWPGSGIAAVTLAA